MSARSESLFAQPDLRESLERLDRNQNGRIDPDEITPLARPYLERIAEGRRLSLYRSNEISEFEEAARQLASRNGDSSRRFTPAKKSGLLPFGADAERPLVPEFGLAEVKYPYLQEDLDDADRALRRYDANRDGYLDRDEAADSMWSYGDPFELDFNKDDRLSRLELGQRYARRRLLFGDSDDRRQPTRRTESDSRRSSRDEDREDNSRWGRYGGRDYWLTVSILDRFDTNQNGRLESHEALSLGIPAARIDIDRDGELSRDELQSYLAEIQREAAGDSEGLPGWFFELDTDRDGQVAMDEFATEWTDEKLQEFARLDVNSDGLLTASEVVRSKAMIGGSYSNRNAEALPPGKTIISEIEIDDDFLIGDLKVQLSITHTNVGSLDCFLTGPDGQRIELFSEVGGSGDHFDQTIFDDRSENPIIKGRAPFRGTFMTEALSKRQPSLSHFHGNQAQGTWQLVVRGTRSERFGMLHFWSLIVEPKENMLERTAAVPTTDVEEKQ